MTAVGRGGCSHRAPHLVSAPGLCCFLCFPTRARDRLALLALCRSCSSLCLSNMSPVSSAYSAHCNSPTTGPAEDTSVSHCVAVVFRPQLTRLQRKGTESDEIASGKTDEKPWSKVTRAAARDSPWPHNSSPIIP